MTVSSVFKVGSERIEAVRIRSGALARPGFRVLLAANIGLFLVFSFYTAHLGIQVKQQAYLSAQLADSYNDRIREIADIRARVQSATNVQQIMQMAHDNELGLAPRKRPGILVGRDSVPLSSDVPQVRGSDSTTLLRLVGIKAEVLVKSLSGALGRHSLLQRSSGAN